MKEAAGEANMTVITIILIGIVLAIGGVIITNLMNKTKSGADALDHGCSQNQYWNGSTCVNA